MIKTYEVSMQAGDRLYTVYVAANSHSHARQVAEETWGGRAYKTVLIRRTK